MIYASRVISMSPLDLQLHCGCLEFINGSSVYEGRRLNKGRENSFAKLVFLRKSSCVVLDILFQQNLSSLDLSEKNTNIVSRIFSPLLLILNSHNSGEDENCCELQRGNERTRKAKIFNPISSFFLLLLAFSYNLRTFGFSIIKRVEDDRCGEAL